MLRGLCVENNFHYRVCFFLTQRSQNDRGTQREMLPEVDLSIITNV